jgi:thiol-disulfide isomerase/thioredoxin
MNKVLFISFLLLSAGLSTASAQESHLIGETSEKEIRETHRIFDIYTNRYQPDKEVIQRLSEIQDSVKIYVLFGTWCHDSKREIPAFFKTLELANNPRFEVEMTAVSKRKTDPTGSYERWNLKNTPTFVIFRNGVEIGRIVEEAEVSMESDLLRILKTEQNPSK